MPSHGLLTDPPSDSAFSDSAPVPLCPPCGPNSSSSALLKRSLRATSICIRKYHRQDPGRCLTPPLLPLQGVNLHHTPYPLIPSFRRATATTKSTPLASTFTPARGTFGISSFQCLNVKCKSPRDENTTHSAYFVLLPPQGGRPQAVPPFPGHDSAALWTIGHPAPCTPNP